MNQYKSYCIKISHIVFSIEAADETAFPIDPNMKGFVVDKPPAPDIHIKIYRGKPVLKDQYEKLTRASNLIEVENGETTLHYYTLHKSERHFLVITGHEKNDVPERYLIADLSYTNWDIYLPDNLQNTYPNPLHFPIGSIIYYYGLSACENILLHASGIQYFNKGFIFSGESGIGKTTISKIWKAEGGEIVNDDRLILDTTDKKRITMHNSPMMYPQPMRESPLNAVFLLRQAKENHMQPLPKPLAYARIAALCIQHDHDKKLIQNMMNGLKKLVEDIPVYELEFLPDRSVVDYVLSHT